DMPAFSSATASAAARNSHASRKAQKELSQASELQSLAYKAALAICPALSPGEKFPREDALALASVIKAWDAVANRIRILRGRPLPGSRRPAPEPLRAASRRKPLNRPPVLPSQTMLSATSAPQ